MWIRRKVGHKTALTVCLHKLFDERAVDELASHSFLANQLAEVGVSEAEDHEKGKKIEQKKIKVKTERRVITEVDV